MAAKKSSRKRKGSDAKAAKAKAKENHEFVTEAEEILERIFEDLSDLEEQRHGRGEINPDLVNQIFRSAHSLKGLAGELVIQRNAISGITTRLEADSQTAKVGVELAKTSKALDRKLKSVLGMREVAQQVRRTTEDQARGFGRIRENVDELRNAVGRITGTLGQQSEACGQMSELLVKVSEETRTHESAAGQIKAATRELIAHSDSLREESERFRV